MKRRIAYLGMAVLVAALGGAWYLWWPAGVPAGQKPLQHLDSANFSELKTSFNQADSTVRVVALLSPT